MTSNSIALAKALEEQRANKEKERQGRTKLSLDKIKTGIDLAGAAGKVIGSVAKGFAQDVHWYEQSDAQTQDDAGELSFGRDAGNVFSGRNFSASPTINNTFPGVMQINFVSTLGSYEEELNPTGTNPTSTIATQVAHTIWAWLRKNNAGYARNYEFADILLVMECLDSLYSYLADGIRQYGTCMLGNCYSSYESMMLKDIIAGPNVQNDLPTFRAYINKAINLINNLAFPNIWPKLHRHLWMNSIVLKDRTSDKSQFYFYKQKLFYIYDEANNLAKASIYGNANLNGSTWFNRFVQMYDALIQSESVAIMMGDIRKAYPENDLITWDLIPEDYVIEPFYEENALIQLHNTILVGDPIDVTDLDIKEYQNNAYDTIIYQGVSQGNTHAGKIRFNCTVTGSALPANANMPNQYAVDTLYDIPYDRVPKPSFNIEWTRNTCSLRSYTDSSSTYVVALTHGTEIFTTATIHSYHVTTGPQYHPNSYKRINLITFNRIQTENDLNLFMQVSSFDWHPRFDNMNLSYGSTSVFTLFEINNLRVLRFEEMCKLNYAAMVSLYNVGSVDHLGKSLSKNAKANNN